ncbi:transposase [Tardisphaera miroshnichenkoae]
MKIKGNRICFPKFGEGIYFRRSEQKLAEIRKIKEIVITKDSGDYCYCSIIYDDDKELLEKAPLSAENAVGIDLGIEKFAPLSDGPAIANPAIKRVEKYGKNLVEIGRFDPSSKTCSRCGAIKHDLALSDRVFHCDVCGLTIDRDLNAAINILNIGLIKVGLVRPELAAGIATSGLRGLFPYRQMSVAEAGSPTRKGGVVHPYWALGLRYHSSNKRANGAL